MKHLVFCLVAAVNTRTGRTLFLAFSLPGRTLPRLRVHTLCWTLKFAVLPLNVHAPELLVFHSGTFPLTVSFLPPSCLSCSCISIYVCTATRGQSGQDRTAKTGQPERNGQNMTAKIGTSRTGHPEQAIWNRIGRTGQAEQHCQDRMPGKSCWDMAARTGLPE
jgi:hypothetical protein